MSYIYEEQKASVFTDEGQRMFLKIRDHVQKCLDIAGVVRMQEAMRVVTGDTWEIMACVDRLVEIGELKEMQIASCACQDRVFVGVNNK